MRTLEQIDHDLAAKRRELEDLKGRETEIYSRIVGYYRSVRNWNKGKREEFDKRLPFSPECETQAQQELAFGAAPSPTGDRSESIASHQVAEMNEGSIASCTYFYRHACPSCKPIRALISEYPISVSEVDVDTDDGMALAIEQQILATPTAIFATAEGVVVGRSSDAHEIAELLQVAG